MRVSLTVTFFLLASLASSSPIDPQRQLINRPPSDVIFRTKHSARQVKGHGVLYFKGQPASRKLELNLRKGEYVCGNKVCKLEPGEIPKNCPDHLCQYPLGGPDLSKQFALA